jgi:hypothetical protein
MRFFRYRFIPKKNMNLVKIRGGGIFAVLYFLNYLILACLGWKCDVFIHAIVTEYAVPLQSNAAFIW